MSHLYLTNPRGLGSPLGLNLPLKLDEGNNMKKMKALRLRVLLSLQSTKKALYHAGSVALRLLMKILRVTWKALCVTLKALLSLVASIKQFLIDNCSPSRELVMKWASDGSTVALFLIGTGVLGIVAPTFSGALGSDAYSALFLGLALWFFIAIASAYFDNKMNKLNEK